MALFKLGKHNAQILPEINRNYNERGNILSSSPWYMYTFPPVLPS